MRNELCIYRGPRTLMKMASQMRSAWLDLGMAKNLSGVMLLGTAIHTRTSHMCVEASSQGSKQASLFCLYK